VPPHLQLTSTPTPCHASFPWSQDELTASASSSGNALSHRLPSRAKTKVLNLHHHRRSSSPYRTTLILHLYKNVISILIIIPTTQPRLHFVSSLASSSITPSELHSPPSFSFTAITRSSSLRTMISTVMN
jgi:hypothetical protein